ncbi:MAG: SH3 domain-containing protein [Firmicutes bacterium]|nr:SH3 domain-containing protein [Bacillota bacterium]
MQTQIDEIMAVLYSDGTVPNTNGNDNPDEPDDNTTANQTVSVTADSVNIRSTASTSANIVTTVSSGTVLTYLDQSSQSDGVWYNVKTSGGSTGWIRSDLCSSPK